MHTTGRWGSYGRWYTSRTSSIAATNSADGPSGKHQPFFNQGLSSFFLAPDAPSRRKPTPHAPAPPSDRPANEGSNANDLPAGCRTPERSSGPPPCHPSCARTPVGSAWGSTPLRGLPQQTVCEPVRRWPDRNPAIRQSPGRTSTSRLPIDPPTRGFLLDPVSAPPPDRKS